MWRDILKQRFSELHVSNEDKTMELGEAVRKFVRPGMKLNPVSLQSRPCASVFEVCRQFRGTDPQFEFISSSMGGTYLALVHLGLVRRIIVSFAGEGYPTPGPSPIVWRALKEKRLQIDNMTMLTISQRLLAGALGVPFIPTCSLAGSSIGDELDAFTEIDDPFGTGARAGLLQAYQPDISFVHVWAADTTGNALCHPPYSENVYGTIAAKEGTILTADHIVPTEEIRKHPHLGRIPGSVVRAVCHAPYGAHPTGNFAGGLPDFRSYGNDYEFMKAHRVATKTPEAYDAFLDEWVFQTKSHAGYVEHLGEERIKKIHFVGEPESWRTELEEQAAVLDANPPANEIENMIIQASRVFAERVREKKIKTVLSGIGHASLMTWLGAHALRDEGYELELMAEIGVHGHDPRPADPFVFNFRNLPTTTMLGDIFETLALHTGGAHNRCMGALGAAQIDRHANLNSTRMGGRFIVGSGGANDIASAASETIVVAQQRPGQFVESVEYITSPGRNIQTVISPLGVYRKNSVGELELAAYTAQSDTPESEVIESIKALCGWPLQVAEDVRKLDPPSESELTLLRMFDPEGLFLGKSTKPK